MVGDVVSRENELLWGDAGDLPEQVELRAGPVALIYEDGCVRYLRVGGKEVLRRIYTAVRDEQWRTVRGTIRDLKIENGGETFRISFVSEHDEFGVRYLWNGRIEGSADGRIVFEFDGKAQSEFKRNRIGFCVLHPPVAVIGAKCKVRRVDGAEAEAIFPKTIAQEQPVNGLKDLAAISYEAAGGVWVTTEFSGDVFETEDQRNWIDDSFKTYCTPLSLPLPVLVKSGDRVKQRVVVRIENAPRVVECGATRVRVTLGKEKLALPKIGFCAAGEALAFSASMRLQQLKPAHVRVEAPMNMPDWQQPFADGFREASALKTKVELALRLSGCPGEDLRDLITTFPEPFQHWAFTSSFARILLSTFGEQTTSKRSLEAFRGFLLKTGLSTLDVAVGAGTEGDLYDLNLQRPPRDSEFFFWSMNPQVHAFDLASISETPRGAQAQVESVQEYFGDSPKAVSPITLRSRGDGASDPRQMSLFGAVWTLGMIAALSKGGATSATFFETTGAKGIMENGGAVFPMYHIFRAMAGSSDAVACEVSDPLSIAAMAVKSESGVRVIVGNYTRKEVEVEIPIGAGAKVRGLNKDTAAPALEQPDSFWSGDAEPLSSALVRVAPFELIFVDQPILPEAF